MLTWILSRPYCSFVNTLIQELIRYQKDWKDIDQVVSFFNEGSPFLSELISIAIFHLFEKPYSNYNI